MKDVRLGRNEKCSCGSKKKYKKCCDAYTGPINIKIPKSMISDKGDEPVNVRFDVDAIGNYSVQDYVDNIIFWFGEGYSEDPLKRLLKRPICERNASYLIMRAKEVGMLGDIGCVLRSCYKGRYFLNEGALKLLKKLKL
ncbi:MAG: hypothetical protein Hyperionvirus23_27 [Hyperionvirus sp.]|uniref:SEC-C motif-containing protein n=1 Tax=Hyperionvirus sp. TaxID=2487770 RepID=A0A3G5AAU5_9VIRU|nr:MAG: hypothetical protein Hyperionvirus23_27 [Hyperionvirus sp.]